MRTSFEKKERKKQTNKHTKKERKKERQKKKMQMALNIMKSYSASLITEMYIKII